MEYMQQRHLQQLSRCYIYITTCKFVLQLFCIRTSYVSLSNYLLLILKFDSVLMGLHDVRNFLNYKTLSSKHVSIFLLRKYYIISQ